MTTTRTAPARTFLPLADSPLLTTPHPHAEYTDLAVRLAEHATPEPATLSSLLTITEPAASQRIAAALDARTDLPPAALALLVAHRPDLTQATARLKNLLFPDGTGACHRFARTIAALAHTPETVNHAYLSSARFTDSAGTADPGMLHTLLGPLLDIPILSGPADAALGALLDARRAAKTQAAAFDLAGAAARERTRHGRIRAVLAARHEQTISQIAQHTSGLTLAADLWFEALLDAADTPEQAGHALAATCTASRILAAGEEPDSPWPSVRARWRQVTAAARSTEAHPQAWHQAWEATATTPDGSVWDPSQRGLVAGYTLLADHVLTRYGHADTPPTPTQCWATDPTGRALLHTVADHLTGHVGHSLLDHFDDQLLIAFVRSLAKNRRDKIPGALHIHGLIAAVKAARSKALFLARPAATSLGIVVPMRAETGRILAPGPGNEDGQDALAGKVAQLAWLLKARPDDARAELLLVDEDPDGASAHTARQACGSHPQIRLSVATRCEETSAKGGAVLWGLAQLHGAGHTVLAYTDLDLTYPLDQLGLHLAALDQPGIGAVVGSRRRDDSHGYYPPAGPNPATRLYQQAVHELLNLRVTDPQAGFKAFTAAALHTALPKVTDHGLSFDTELLAILAATGHTVTEVGIAALHRWTDKQTGTPRDYDAMLRAVHEQALRHGLAPEKRKTPVWDKIRAVGSLAAASSQPVSVTIIPTPR
ncbi:glycosyltransferase [Streptomyces sp. S1D4-20]|uniref:glycosyltransferase n=1 Tax=Streptomyces sp. S1D4-20 TaxID=2594462 RepID=UPI001165AF27|nr:glycosyltransferase [Streptomyces sp. S1D4-20]QDN54175.1 glycosyltransferase [Streptomyces sp. S1D4-20]